MDDEPKKKRAKPVTMTSRSRSWLEKQGYIVSLVERQMWLEKKVNGVPTGEKFLQKWDCFGFADLIAVHRDKPGVIFIQTTTQDNAAARRDRVLLAPAVVVILEAQNRVHVHGWALKGPRGGRKLWQVNVYELRFCGNNLNRLEFVQNEIRDVEEDGTSAESLFELAGEEAF